MQTVVHLISGDGTEQETALAIARNIVNDETGSVDEVAVVVQPGGMEAIKIGQESEEHVRAVGRWRPVQSLQQHARYDGD